MKIKRTQLSIPEPMLAQLDEIADKKGLPRAELIRYIINDYLERQGDFDGEGKTKN